MVYDARLTRLANALAPDAAPISVTKVQDMADAINARGDYQLIVLTQLVTQGAHHIGLGQPDRVGQCGSIGTAKRC